MIARPGRSPRPARPTAWTRSWYVRSAARSSGRFRATSDETTPTSVTAGMSRPLATRLVPTRTSSRAVGEGVDDPLRRAAVLDDVAVEAADPQAREALADLALDAFRAAAEVADPGRAAGRAARRERRRPAAVMAAQRRPGLVVDERALAVGAGLDVAAVAAQDDRRGPAPVEDEDRLVAGARSSAAERRRQRRATAGRACPPASSARRSTTSTVGGAPAGAIGQDDAVVVARRARGRRSRPPASRDPRTTAAPASRPAGSRRRGPGAAASGRSCTPRRAPRRR